MSSSRNDQKSCDAEMGDTLHGSTLDSQAPRAVSTQISEFLSFQTELDRREAEGSAIPKPDGASILPATTDALTSLAEVLSPHDVAVGGDETVAVIPPAEVTDQPSGSSTTLAPIVEPELTSGLMPPPTAKREIFLGQCARSAAPLVPLKGRKRSSANPYAAKKRQCVKGFISLIDGMIKDYGSEVERLTKELAESQDKLPQLEAKLKVIEDSHSLEISQFETQIGEFEQDLGMTASLLLKAKKAKKTNRLARIAHSLDSLMVVRDRDLELATIEGRMSEVQLFQGDEALSLQAQEVRLSAHNGALVAIEGDFDLIFAGLKSECVLQPCQGNSEGQDLVVEDVRGDVVAEDKDEAMGEGEVPSLDE
ncbi:hypothetical protein F2Q68_00015241 [Brassica cretica]|uniref:Uncharacterized protein n=1 Tax=Brassica cretica TaxID=69181 RepID=A0A8S9HKT5_BRACR|nr:hypothetical protein F2Q68_00015241 [Brassica cretica]